MAPDLADMAGDCGQGPGLAQRHESLGDFVQEGARGGKIRKASNILPEAKDK